jgi:eukaryotic-like serine/threonine-protein kinase
MILREGQVLGPYRVLALAGSGGTGEVWRARDDRLQRDVALKVMHGSLGDEESRRRLLAEARAVGALDHPHIVVVHDILCVEDRDVLVMEFVTGEAVSRRIPPGGMTLREALKLAVAVADAVAAAHTAGVTHRDLKPANVLVSGSGSPKVLDFGLARRRPAAGPADITMLGAPESAAGLISGTPAYMSPEQAQGKPVDHRSDVFSFGALLYELLTGRCVFERPSIPETLTAVLKDEPAIPEGWPVALAHVVKRCLRKDAERRFQNMADVRIELQDVLEACDGTTDAGRGRPRRRATWTLRVIGAAVTVALMMIASWWALRHRSPEQAWTVRTLTTLPGVEQQAVLSRRAADRVAFVWDGGRLQNHDIYMQQVSGETPPVRLTTDIRADISPAWSPDDQQLAFLRLYGDRTDVIVMSALGGSERRVGRVPGGFAQATGVLLPLSTIDWSPDGQFIALGTSTLSLLNVLTGEVIQFSPAPAPGTDRDPAFSPDGRALVYSRGAARVYRQLWVQRIHADGRADGLPELLTPEFRVYDGARWLDNDAVIAAAGWVGSQVGLFRVGKHSGLRPLAVESVSASYPSYSLAQRRLVYQRRTIDTDVMRIALGEHPALDREPLIASTSQDREAKYSPDGTKIAFISTRSGQPAVWRADRDGSNQILIGGVDQGVPGAPRWTSDGQSVVFDASSAGTGSDVYVVGAEGGTPRRLTSGKGHELRPSLSADGQWLYYSSENQVWKVAIKGGAPVKVTSGGTKPRESLDGRWLYYSKDNAVWRLATTGGAEELFLPDLTENNWTLSAEAMYVIEIDAAQSAVLVSFDLQTRQKRLLLPFAPGTRFFSADWLDVTADGRSALISVLTRDESDLVVVDGIQ